MVTINSNTKKILITFAAVMVFLSTFQLIYACIHNDGEQIFWTIFNLIIDAFFLLVLIKQWEKGLKIYSIAYMVLAAFSLLALIALILIAIEGKQQNDHMGETIISVILGGLLYALLAYLLKKYISQVEYNEGYTIA